MRPSIAALVPNYKTPELTKLCLRLLRKHADHETLRVLAIDNDSDDASLDYLRSLDWIELVERKGVPGETPSESHARALDFALDRITEPYVLSLHTDTLVRRSGFERLFLDVMQSDENIAGVGSWKLELKSPLKRLAKRIEAMAQRGRTEERRYLRSHCALYRTHSLRHLNLGFSIDGDTAGRAMHFRLEDAGHRLVFLSPRNLLPWLVHVNHGTMVIREELGASPGTRRKGMRRLRRLYSELGAGHLLADESLDR